MIVFSDLHLRERSEDVCFRVLDWVEKAALASDKHVICCGDFWHIRYRISVRLLNRVAALLYRWSELGIWFDVVPGNHDQIDVSGQNALEIFEAYNCNVWTDPGLNENGLGFVPYRKDHSDQYAALVAVMQEDPKAVYSHFGVHGSEMNSGMRDQDGLTLPDLKCPLVLGHYHKHQVGTGWEYVGSPYQTNFGEAGNVCGALIDGQFTEIDVQAPKHHIIKWDPAKSEEPPARPGDAVDKVRLDIEASQEMLIKGKFKGVLKQSGLEDAQVNVVPVAVEREHKFQVEPAEDLLVSAKRFAIERLGTEDVQTAMEALHKWAGVR